MLALRKPVIDIGSSNGAQIAKMKSESQNQPAAGNSGASSLLRNEQRWPGVPESARQAASLKNGL